MNIEYWLKKNLTISPTEIITIKNINVVRHDFGQVPYDDCECTFCETSRGKNINLEV